MNPVITDKDLLLAYKNAKKYVKQYGCPKEKRAEFRNELIYNMDNVLVRMKYSELTEIDKQKLIAKGKTIYKEYCSFAKGHPEDTTEQLDQRASELAGVLASMEAESIALSRINLEVNQYLDVNAIFSCKQYVRKFMNNPIINTIEHAAQNSKLKAIKEFRPYYISEHGKRYHEEDCIYCRGRIIHENLESYYINAGIKPCTCVIKAKSKVIKQQQDDCCTTQKSVITAFVDESIHKNPAASLDIQQDNMQGVLSVIMCYGKIKSEDLITKSNTLTKFVHIAESTSSTVDIAIEAIGEVMLKAATRGFSERLIIYTDNKTVVRKWKENEVLAHFSKAFQRVDVYYIGRKNNTKADGLIRRNSIIQISKEKMNKLIRLDQENK